MGIDIYARWRGQTAEEADAQCTGFSAVDGHVGYLREAYHGEPYATHVLVPEAFERDFYPDGAPIPAATLKERLPRALDVVLQREVLLYDADPSSADVADVQQSYKDFVALCEEKERETGEPVRIIASY